MNVVNNRSPSLCPPTCLSVIHLPCFWWVFCWHITLASNYALHKYLFMLLWIEIVPTLHTVGPWYILYNNRLLMHATYVIDLRHIMNIVPTINSRWHVNVMTILQECDVYLWSIIDTCENALRNQLSMEQNIIIVIIIITIMHIDWIVSVIHYRLILNDRMIKMLWHRTRWSIALLLMIIQHLTCYIYGLSMLRDASWMLCWFTCSIFKTCETVVAISSLRKRTGQSKHYAQHQRHQQHHA